MKQARVLDIKIDLISKPKLLREINEAVYENRKLEIFTVNNEFVVDAQKNLEFKEILNTSDINIADSTGVVWALKRQGIECEKIPGADVFYDICRLCNEKKYSVFLLGGEQNSASMTAKFLKLRFEDIEIAGIVENIKIAHNKTEPQLIAKINRAKPDIVFVALGAPKQEIWIRNNKNKLNAKVFMGVGGTFDFVSGRIPRAPEWVRGFGLEWLYRLIIEPSRYKRIYKALVTFPKMVKRSNSY